MPTMARECYLCEKTSKIGHSQKHRRGVAGKRWMNRTTPTPRVFKANLQAYSINEEGKDKKVTLCTRCIKRLRFDGKNNLLSA